MWRFEPVIDILKSDGWRQLSCHLVLMRCLFFFKQKTAYEMRISDWSSDVCSSDLWRSASRRPCSGPRPIRGAWASGCGRSEERRVGKSVSVRVDLGGRRIIKKKKNVKLTRYRRKSLHSVTLPQLHLPVN